MSIDLGTSNSTRYHSVPDHADFTLPNNDWTWLALVYPQNTSAIKYIVSTGAFGAGNSFNLVAYNPSAGFGASVKVDSLIEQAVLTSIAHDKHHWIYGTRRSGMLYAGQVGIGTSTVVESPGGSISAAYNSTVGPEIGRRSDGTANRYWQGRWEQIAFIPGTGLSTADAIQLANGVPLLAMPFAKNIKFMLHGRGASTATLTDLIGGKVATRQGTSYGTTETDRLSPYLWLPSYIRGVSAPVTEHNLTVANAVQENTGGTGTVSQVHALTADSSTQTNLVPDSTVTVGVAVTLTAEDATQGNTAGTGAITQAHVLVHPPSIQDNVAAESAVVQEHILAGSNATQANVASAPAIDVPGTNDLAADSSVQGNAVSTGAIAVIGINDLSADAITQANNASSGAVTRPQTLTTASAIQVNRASSGAITDGIIFEAALAAVTSQDGIKKPGIPNDAPEWLKTTLETVLGRRGNQIEVPEKQDLTFSGTPTQAELESLYSYTNSVRETLEQLIKRLDS